MGMEISSRRLQEADSRMQAERKGADRPVDDKDKENTLKQGFDHFMD